MRNLVLMSFAILSLGCTSREFPAAPPDYPAAPLGTLLINLNISGDASTGVTKYTTILDGVQWNDLAPGENRFLVPSGNHTVSLAPLSLLAPTWCASVDANRYSGPLPGGSTTTVTFSVECPPLVGTGVITLTFSASGGATPPEISAYLIRLNGPTLTFSFPVQANKPVGVTIPAGLYRIGTNGAGNCKPPSTFGLFGTNVRVVRSGTDAIVNLPLTCT